jgi:hypothetical protein
VHVETVGAPIDLRGAHHHQMHQFLVETAGIDRGLNREQGLKELRVAGEIDSGFHDGSVWFSEFH